LANRYLRSADAALARWRTPGDTESLRRFRVAVRKLRNLLAAHGPWLGRAASGKVRRGLRQLARATSHRRDAEVQLSWLVEARKELPPGLNRGVARLMRRLRAVRRNSFEKSRRRTRRDFTRVEEQLRIRLEERVPAGPSYRAVFPALLRFHAASLEASLVGVRGPDDQEGAHRVRLRAKSLRYLLEPIRLETRGARRLVGALKDLQDLLGQTNDLHILSATLEAEIEALAEKRTRRLQKAVAKGGEASIRRMAKGEDLVALLTLAARARGQLDALQTRLERTWLRGRGRAFFVEAAAEADRIAEGLGAPARIRPRGLHLELE
jgi:CHAD domain-containing protein